MSRQIKVRVEMSEVGPSWDYGIAADDQASDSYVQPGNRIDLPQGPQAIIEFRLQGREGKRLDFRTDDPIWVEQGACPNSPGDGDGEIQIKSCSANRLEILNLNSKVTDLHYRLNFRDEHGNELHWDPIIRNGGGGP